MTDKPATVQVEIFGQTYRVRAGAEPGYVEQLAKHVDSEMREVGKTARAVDSLRQWHITYRELGGPRTGHLVRSPKSALHRDLR